MRIFIYFYIKIYITIYIYIFNYISLIIIFNILGFFFSILCYWVELHVKKKLTWKVDSKVYSWICY